MLEIFEYTFFRYAVIGVILISISAAIIGSYIITRRLVAISGGVTHACFGGLGLGCYLGINPIAMAAVFAIASSLGVEWASSRFKLREDSTIAVIWAVGMAIGVLFVFLTPGFVPELNSFLFGNVLTISPADLWAFGIFTALLIAFFAWKYRWIVACAFDRDFARVSGLPVRYITSTMTVLVAVCIVLTIRLVGIMLLLSMVTVPVLIAETWSRRFINIMLAAIIISIVSSLGGLLVATIIDVPCSAIIVLLQVALYFVARIGKDISLKRPIR